MQQATDISSSSACAPLAKIHSIKILYIATLDLVLMNTLENGVLARLGTLLHISQMLSIIIICPIQYPLLR